MNSSVTWSCPMCIESKHVFLWSGEGNIPDGYPCSCGQTQWKNNLEAVSSDTYSVNGKFEKVTVRVDCDCGCGELAIERDDDGLAYLSYNIPAFYAKQEGRRDRVKRVFSILWHLLILDREYRLYEIVLNKEEVKKFRDTILKL